MVCNAGGDPAAEETPGEDMGLTTAQRHPWEKQVIWELEQAVICLGIDSENCLIGKQDSSKGLVYQGESDQAGDFIFRPFYVDLSHSEELNVPWLKTHFLFLIKVL